MIILKDFLTDIFAHNKEIYDNTPHNEKIDFSKTKVSWGKNVTPLHLQIDLKKEYKTRNGYKVILNNFVLYNSSNNEVTYPIKGHYIIPNPKGRDKIVNAIWAIDGRSLVQNIENDLDLIAC